LKKKVKVFKLVATNHKAGLCYGFQACLTLIKRQDLFSLLLGMFSKQNDLLTITIPMAEDKFDSFIFAVLRRKEEKKLRKEQNDLAPEVVKTVTSRLSTPEKLVSGDKTSEKGGKKTKKPIDGNFFSVLCDTNEIVEQILTPAIAKSLVNNAEFVKSIYFSDQNEGSDVYKKILKFEYILPSNNDMETLQTLMKMTMHMITLVSEIRLSKMAKQKSMKIRAKLQEKKEKDKHEERQENAQKRKLDKIKAEDERIQNMSESQKLKYEEKKAKKEAKKKNNAKMKMRMFK